MKKLQRKSTTVGDMGSAVIRPLCVTIDETADMLSVGRNAVYQLIADGEIEAIKLGKSTRVTTASLDRLLERRSSLSL
jgi:excisionase family DNA binding protein